MAAFVAKQIVGKKLDSVKGALGDKDDKDDKTTENGEEDAVDAEEIRKEVEERRKEKYSKLEEEREKMRQDIRDKYGLKRKDDAGVLETDVQDSENKKTQSSASAAAGQTDVGDERGFVLPRNFEELTTKMSQLPGIVVANVESTANRCTIA